MTTTVCPSESLKESEICPSTNCPFHIFNDEVYIPSLRSKGNWEKHLTPKVIELNGCLKYLDHPMSLSEVGNIYGLTREGVRWIEEHALKKVMFQLLNDPEAQLFINSHFPLRRSRKVWADGEGRYEKSQESVYSKHLSHKPYQRRLTQHGTVKTEIRVRID